VSISQLPPRHQRPWWRDAVTYQIYIRSFADSNGDGIGDINGIRSRLPYLKKLGINAIWITPWYPSPQHDHGYDVADFMNIEPDYGTLDDAKALIDEAHALDIKIIADIVPNHTSSEHEWFKAALAAGPGSPERERYIFRDGKGPNGDIPPNNWEAVFGGGAWERVIEADGKPGQWYLHLFAVEQPDLNWENPEIHQHFEDVLNFWFTLGIDGFRVDVAHGLIKEKGLPDIVAANPDSALLEREYRPYWDQEGVHEIYRRWRKIMDSYPGDRMAVSEAWAPTAERIARYIRPDELSNSFNFDFLKTIWDAEDLKTRINRSLESVREVGAPCSWVLENHDVTRSVDRLDLGLSKQKATTLSRQGDPALLNIHRGRLRATSAALLMFALPGGTYIYQGEELAVPEVRDIPEERLTDPTWKMSGYMDRGRDGCRVPIPWRSEPQGGFGFSADPALRPDQAWLPQSPWWGSYSVQSQEGIEFSPLEIYRRALAIRAEEPGLGDGEMFWIEEGPHVLAFERAGNFACYINFDQRPYALPHGAEVLVSSAPLIDGAIPQDVTVWLRLPV